MGKYSEAFVAFDVAKMKHAVAIAEGEPWLRHDCRRAPEIPDDAAVRVQPQLIAPPLRRWSSPQTRRDQ
jgi:hypothetical protein